jgi:hypothetical protein
MSARRPKADDVIERVQAKMNVRLAPLAKFAGLSPTALRLAIERDEVSAVRVGRNILIPHQEAARILGMKPESVAA